MLLRPTSGTTRSYAEHRRQVPRQESHAGIQRVVPSPSIAFTKSPIMVEQSGHRTRERSPDHDGWSFSADSCGDRRLGDSTERTALAIACWFDEAQTHLN